MSRRRILSLEALEDRTLLSGNVISTLNPTNGVLTIVGDPGNNSITISASPIPGDLRVAGNLNLGPPPDFTTVDSVHFKDYTLSSITSINVLMLNGNDTVNVGGPGTGFAIPNNLMIHAGSGTDTFTTSGISANSISITATGPGADSVTMDDTNAGLVNLSTGGGNDNISMDNHNAPGLKIGMLRINSGGGNDSVSVANFPSIGPISGIGQFSVDAGAGNNTVNATNSTFTTASLTAGNGNNHITFASPKVLLGTTITAGNGTNTINVSGNLNTLALTTTGGGTYSFNNSTATSASINVGTPGTTARTNVTASNDTVTGAMTVNAKSDGPQYWSTTPLPNGTILPSSNLTMSNDTVGGALNVSTGNFFRNVAVGASAASLNATIGSGTPLTSNSETVLFNTNVTNAENITVGNFFPTQPPIPLLSKSSFTLNGTAGSLALTVGDNAAGGVSQNAIVAGDESVTVGANAGAVTVVRPTNGNSTIAVGDNAASLTVTGDDDALAAALTETITVGSNFVGPVAIGGNLLATLGGSWTQNIIAGDNDTINVSMPIVAGSQTITTGNGDTVSVGLSTVVSLAITAGNNANISVSDVTATGVGGVNVGAGDGATVSLETVTATVDSVSVTAGNDAVLLSLDNVTADHGSANVTAGNNAAEISVTNTTASSMSITNGDGDTFIVLSADNVGTNGADLGLGLSLVSGNGDNTLEMLGLNVSDGLFATFGSGINTVFAGNVVADFGIVDGGIGGSNVYYDLGGNSGYFVTDFIGF